MTIPPAPPSEPFVNRRTFWVAAGWISLTVGAIGAVLPVLPTTPFVILAAFAFGKGSPKLRSWLVNHPRFGPAILDWEAHGAIARRHKFMACALMAATFAVSAIMDVKDWVLLIQAVCMIPAGIYIVTRPDGGQENPRT